MERYLCNTFDSSSLFYERKIGKTNEGEKWYCSNNGMIGFSVCGKNVLNTVATRLTKHFIDDIISAFEETLGYRPKYDTQNIMNVVQTITLIDE